MKNAERVITPRLPSNGGVAAQKQITEDLRKHVRQTIALMRNRYENVDNSRLQTGQTQITPSQIVNATACFCGVESRKIVSRNDDEALLMARGIVGYLLRNDIHYSLSRVSQFLLQDIKTTRKTGATT